MYLISFRNTNTLYRKRERGNCDKDTLKIHTELASTLEKKWGMFFFALFEKGLQKIECSIR